MGPGDTRSSCHVQLHKNLEITILQHGESFPTGDNSLASEARHMTAKAFSHPGTDLSEGQTNGAAKSTRL